MFKNYFITTLRNLVKHKIHSILTILGLAVGLAASAIIIIINYTEMNYDRHWADANRIYQLEVTSNYNDNASKEQSITAEFYELIKNKLPEVAHISRVQNVGTKIKHTQNSTGTQTEFEERVLLVDNSFFEIFNYKLQRGNIKDFYTDEAAIIISDDLSTKLFGKENPVGKIIGIDTSNFGSRILKAVGSNARPISFKDYKVVAVTEKTSHKSSIPSQSIFTHLQNNKTMEIEKNGNNETRYSYSYPMYLKIKINSDISKILKALPALQDEFIPSMPGANQKPSQVHVISALNIKDTHLKSAQTSGQMEKIWMLFGLAAIILMMASINYINLALAAYSRRQKEIALRKTMGASKKNIIQQFLSESLLITGIALCVAFILIELITPWLKNGVNLDIANSNIYDPRLIGYLFLMATLVGLISGAYPSFYLSQFNPATTLKSNKSIESATSIKFRQALVITQFVISGIMLTCVSIIAVQMHKVQSYDPGYQTRNIIFATHEGLGGANLGDIQSLKYQISKIPGVQAVEFSMPTIPGKNSMPMSLSRQGDESKPVRLHQATLAGPDDLKVFNIKLLAGKYFSAPVDIDAKNQNSMQDKIYINHQALTILGFKNANEAINQKVDVTFNENYKIPMTIVAVTDSVHIGSLNAPDVPCFFWPIAQTALPIAIAIRYEHQNRNDVSEQVKKVWRDILGYTPYSWFIEDVIADEYKNENLIAKFVYIFTGIAIFISCLGLYGLATHATTKRKKEIGLRKVNGASVFNIVKLLLWQFSKPVLLANIIIWPLALYAGSRWLEQFVDRIDIWVWGPVFCLSSALLALLIAWLTVGGHAFIVAREKPVAALREE